jgi:hypothetical protein
MTDENKIEQMLKAFYNGDSTPEEEVLLLKLFNNKDLEEKWHTDRDILIALHDSSDITLPEGISERLENALDNHIAETSITENKLPAKKIPLFSKTRRLYIAVASSAAAILLCIGIFFATENRHKQNMIADTYTNPEEAAIAVEKALMLVSTKLNQGLSPLEKVQDSVDKTNELLNDNFK